MKSKLIIEESSSSITMAVIEERLRKYIHKNRIIRMNSRRGGDSLLLKGNKCNTNLFKYLCFYIFLSILNIN